MSCVLSMESLCRLRQGATSSVTGQVLPAHLLFRYHTDISSAPWTARRTSPMSFHCVAAVPAGIRVSIRTSGGASHGATVMITGLSLECWYHSRPPPEASHALLSATGVLPTGRNIHALDPYRMPGTAALQRGTAAAAAIIESHRKANNGGQ